MQKSIPRTNSTVFIKTEGGGAALQPSALTSTSTSSGGWDGKMGNGLVVELGERESIESANPGRPNAQFDPFVTAIIRQIGLTLEIPYEVLVKHYASSYSAARAALLDAWGYFKVRRSRLAEQFCQPIYEAWLDEAVATGYVTAPAYFSDPLTRRAWQGALWIGDGPGAIDPVKEIEASERRIALTVSTFEQESLLYDGGKWRRKLRKLTREHGLLRTAAIAVPTLAAAPPVGAPQTYPSDPQAGT